MKCGCGMFNHKIIYALNVFNKCYSDPTAFSHAVVVVVVITKEEASVKKEIHSLNHINKSTFNEKFTDMYGI